MSTRPAYPPGDLVERYHLPVTHPLHLTYSVVVTDTVTSLRRYLVTITGPHGVVVRGTGRRYGNDLAAKATALQLLAALRVRATVHTIDACMNCATGEQHPAHSRMSTSWPDTPPRLRNRHLWCLGYYDQDRQSDIILIDLDAADAGRMAAIK